MDWDICPSPTFLINNYFKIMVMQILKSINLFYSRFLFRVSKLNTYSIIIFVILINLIWSFILSELVFSNFKGGFQYDSLIQAILILVLLVPFFETMIFQFLIIDFILKKFPSNYLFATSLSTLVFAASHFYSAEFVIKTLLSGFLYSSIYIIFVKKNVQPIIHVSITHSLYNLIAVIEKFW